VIIGLGLLMGAAVAWALGARLSALAELRFRGDPLVFAALAIQLVIFTPLQSHVPKAYEVPLHGLSYGLILLFCALNLRRPGFWITTVGVLSNALVIAINRGLMPVTLEAWKASGNDPRWIASGTNNNNVLAGPGTHLSFLGDIFGLPPALPFATAISVGDIVILLGMVAFIYRSCVPPAPKGAGSLLTPLRSAPFRRVIAGRFVSSVGDWFSQAACVTWIYATSHSTLLVSAFLVSRILSFIVGGIVSAPLLTRFQGFRALSMVEWTRGLLTVGMIPLAIAGHVWPVIGLAALSSFFAAVTNPSAASLIPELIPAGLLQAGNTLHNLSRTITSIGGAAVGGFLVISLGVGWALGADVVTFVLSALLYRRFAAPAAGAAGPAEQPEDTGGTSRRSLVRAIVGNRVVLSLTVSFSLATAAWGLLNATASALFDQRLHQPEAYGYVVAIINVGYFFGEVFTGFMRRQTLARRSIAIAFLATGGAVLGLSGSTELSTAYLMLLVIGASDGVTEVVHDTLIQLNTPRQTRAGLFAVVGSIERGGMVLGIAAAPLLVARMPSESVIKVSAATLGVAAFVAAAGLVTRRPLRADVLTGDEQPVTPVPPPAPAPAELDMPVPPVLLELASGAQVTAGDLTVGRPLVLALLDAAAVENVQGEALQELAGQGARVVTVARAGASVAWGGGGDGLVDPHGQLFDAFAVPTGHCGLAVLDGSGFVRLMFAEHEPGAWIPGAVVKSRLRRLATADTPPVTVLHASPNGARVESGSPVSG
jgi:MFS family permease